MLSRRPPWLFAGASIVAVITFAPPASAANRVFELAAFSEENLPAEEMPPTSTPSPGAGAIVPPGTASQPQPTPLAIPADIAPLEVGTVQPRGQISDESLRRYIVTARSPALAASLRATDQAREAMLANSADSAIQMLQHALSIDAQNPWAYFYLGRAWLNRGNYPQAITFFGRAELGFGANPDWLGETLAFEGMANEQAQNSAAAIASYQKALTREPGNLMARVGLSRLGGSIEAAPLAAPTPAGSAITAPPAAAPIPPPPQSSPPQAAY